MRMVRFALIAVLSSLVGAVSYGQTQHVVELLETFKSLSPSREKADPTPRVRPKDWIGDCFGQPLPYLGLVTYTDGTFPSWGGYYDQPHAETCRTTDGYYADVFLVDEAHPGDVYDIPLGAAYNTFLGISGDNGSTFYDHTFVTAPGTGSQTGKYVGGLTITVPASFTRGSFYVYVERQDAQTHYLLGVRKTSDARPTTCQSATTNCLNGERFKVTVDWLKPDGTSGVGQAISLSDDTGYFWFFNAANVELVIKVLDGRAINNHFWVFYGALSNVQYTIRVLDTASGLTRTYTNPQSNLASVADTLAF